jgi:hypothetical protein
MVALATIYSLCSLCGPNANTCGRYNAHCNVPKQVTYSETEHQRALQVWKRDIVKIDTLEALETWDTQGIRETYETYETYETCKTRVKHNRRSSKRKEMVFFGALHGIHRFNDQGVGTTGLDGLDGPCSLHGFGGFEGFEDEWMD